MKERFARMVVNNDKSKVYLYTDNRKVRSKIKELNCDCEVFEFRRTSTGYWEKEIYKMVDNDEFVKIQTIDNGFYTRELNDLLEYLKIAEWNSSIEYPMNGYTNCPNCGSEVVKSDIGECFRCGEALCLECRDSDFTYNSDIDIHSVCECPRDGLVDCTEQYCYDDDCPFWNIIDCDGLSKSNYDENREFIENLNPNDPADAWFFED